MSLARPFVTQIAEVLLELRFGDAGGYEDFSRRPPLPLWSHQEGVPPACGSHQQDVATKDIKSQSAHDCLFRHDVAKVLAAMSASVRIYRSCDTVRVLSTTSAGRNSAREGLSVGQKISASQLAFLCRRWPRLWSPRSGQSPEPYSTMVEKGNVVRMK